MKKFFTLVAMLLAAVLLLSAGAFAFAEEADAYIVYPSDTHLNMAPGRDFYVFARVADAYKDSVTGVTIELKDAAGKTVREVHSGAADAYKTDYAGINAFNTEQDEWLMPDIMYNSKDAASLAYAWNKCYVKEGYGIGFITGGVNKVITDFKNEDGSAFEPIKEGEKYSLVVTFALKDGKSLTASKTITMSTAPKKVLSRFSPDSFLDMVEDFAEKNGLMIYLDPFAGYWTASFLIEGQKDNKYFAEIKSIWQPADAMEYIKGDVSFFLYNVSAGCATNSVEILKMHELGDIDKRMDVYRLSLGEPSLEYTTIIGEDKTETSEIVKVEDGDKLAFTRAEVRKLVDLEDNKYVAYTKQVKDVDANLADGIAVDVDDTLTLYGVALPIQNTPEQLKTEDGSLAIGNYISKVTYSFAKGGEVIYSGTKDVTLTRTIEEGWDGVSIYEFAHSFKISPFMVGELDVSVTALDSEGKSVYGTAEGFKLKVSADGTFVDVSSDLPKATFVYALENAGVVNGCGDRVFAPDRSMTVGEAVTMIARAEGVTAANGSGDAAKLKCSPWLAPYVSWAAEKGLIVLADFSETAVITAGELDGMLEKCGIDCDLSGDGPITRIQASPSIAKLLA